MEPLDQHTLLAGPRQRLEARAGGRSLFIERTADLESLWERMGAEDFGDDERLPYWVELWPAALLLADWVAREPGRVAGRTTLDLGCGLGLTALAAAAAGAKVLGLDYELPALRFARENAALNQIPGVLWVQMDWREPGLAQGAFERILGADILYERRFFEPLEGLLRRSLAPGGIVWIAEPAREVSARVWDELRSRGWRTEKKTTETVRAVTGGDYTATVHLWELTRND
ncbi:MAG TPA: methyltransferase [Desulfovibrio sp.]|nr:methyltransferase [Desulfovibrio sp.]